MYVDKISYTYINHMNALRKIHKTIKRSIIKMIRFNQSERYNNITKQKLNENRNKHNKT